MLAWLNLKRHNFIRLNFKFHGVKIRSQSSCGGAVEAQQERQILKFYFAEMEFCELR